MVSALAFIATMVTFQVKIKSLYQVTSQLLKKTVKKKAIAKRIICTCLVQRYVTCKKPSTD